MNHEPNKLALLISLICAGTSAHALGLTLDRAAEHCSQPAAIGVVQPTLETAQAWPLILNGIRDLEAGSLGLSLPLSTPHVLPLASAWRETEDGLAHAAESEEKAAASLDPETSQPAVEIEAEDPLERANATAHSEATPAKSARPHVPTLRLAAQREPVEVESFPAEEGVAESHTTTHPSLAMAMAIAVPLARQPPITEEIDVAPSAQRVMDQLAAIRFPAAEVPEATPAPTPTPTPEKATSGETVLSMLRDVMVAPAVTSHSAHAADAGKESLSLEAAIAARREVKRMNQRRRAEAGALVLAKTVAEAVAEAVAETAAPAATQAEPAHQATFTTRANPFGGERLAVRDNALDRVRGGFVTNNLNITFGIERAVYINGSLVTTTSLNVSDTGRISTGTDSKLVTPSSLALIQSGAGNSVAGGAFSSGVAAGVAAGVVLNANAAGTVVQNTLDGQKIQNVTVINASANSLGVLRGLNLQNSLRSSLIDSLRR